jgi:DNA-binding NtrC family response regulator
MSDARARLLIVENDAFLRRQIATLLAGGSEILEAANREEGLAMLRGTEVDLLLLDMRLPPDIASIAGGLQTAEEVRRLSPGTLTIAMSGDQDREAVLRAAGAGVYDFVTKPLDIPELEIIIRRALDRRHLEVEVRRLREELSRRYDFRNLKGNSPAMQAVKNAIRKVADSTATIMIRGEGGTGKELVARALHFNSSRRNGRFVALNCSALPEHLIEDELFGHEKEAFTGALARREGRLEMADGGTLFLDEVGTLTAAIQGRLLRVLKTREFERLGGKDTVRVDLRLVTATNQDLEQEVAGGRFRKDLYYRLNVVTIQIPPLRDRREDVPLLVDHFLDRFCQENNMPRKHLSPEALECLLAHEWQGNVRELEHIVESLVLLSEENLISARDLPAELRAHSPVAAMAGVALPDSGIMLEKHIAEFERSLIASALARTAGKKKEAAGLLGLNKDQMKYLCRKYNL